MSKWQACFEIDTERDIHGDALGANYDHPQRCEDGEVLNFAQTFGADPGDQWDAPNRPHVRLLQIEPMLGVSGRAEETLTQIQHIAYDGALMIDNLPHAELEAALPKELYDYVRALEAKVERIAKHQRSEDARRGLAPAGRGRGRRRNGRQSQRRHAERRDIHRRRHLLRRGGRRQAAAVRRRVRERDRLGRRRSGGAGRTPDAGHRRRDPRARCLRRRAGLRDERRARLPRGAVRGLCRP